MIVFCFSFDFEDRSDASVSVGLWISPSQLSSVKLTHQFCLQN